MTRRINLALQGGGAHGAFTWGVLDRLLDEGDLEIAAVSGTSAGALNGAALKAGMVQDGRAGAKASLEWLWTQIGALPNTDFAPWMGGTSPRAVSKAIEYSPMFTAMDMMSRLASPYGFGPFYQNPLRSIVNQLSFACICDDDGPALHICATNVRSGKVRVFTGDEISVDAILASACLPTLFKAVEIDDPKTGQTEAFWDGGYTGNPALFPLFAPDLPDDIVVVNINPLYRPDVPNSPQEIQNRINEISFNSSLFRELRAISFVRRLLDTGELKPGTMKDVKVHMIADDALMADLSVATKMVPNAMILNTLRDAGRAAAEKFLVDDGDKINVKSSVNLVEMFS